MASFLVVPTDVERLYWSSETTVTVRERSMVSSVIIERFHKVEAPIHTYASGNLGILFLPLILETNNKAVVRGTDVYFIYLDKLYFQNVEH